MLVLLKTARATACLLIATACLAFAQQNGRRWKPDIPKTWDEDALRVWATPLAGLNVPPTHLSAKEYYSFKIENLRTYPVYFPGREPEGYWEMLQRVGPQPLIEPNKLVICLFAVADGATLREIFSNSTVFLSFSVGGTSSSGSGFILFRPNDPSKANDPKGTEGKTFLVTNKHVLPPEGKECTLSMRVTTGTQVSPTVVTIEVPTVGPDGKYLPSVHLHPKNDVAVIAVTPEVVRHKMRPDFVFTALLGTKDKLVAGGVGLVLCPRNS